MKKYLSRFIMYGVTALSLSGCAAVAVPFVAGVVYKYHDEIAEMIGDPSERKVKTSKEIYSKIKSSPQKNLYIINLIYQILGHICPI
jgi:uncharacterized membrane protein YheB (UPF0754 family)